MKSESLFNSLLVDNYLITFFLGMCLSEPCLFLSLSCYKLLVFYITCITVHLLKPGSPRQWEPFRWQNWNNRLQHIQIYQSNILYKTMKSTPVCWDFYPIAQNKFCSCCLYTFLFLHSFQLSTTQFLENHRIHCLRSRTFWSLSCLSGLAVY